VNHISSEEVLSKFVNFLFLVIGVSCPRTLMNNWDCFFNACFHSDTGFFRIPYDSSSQ